MPLCERACNGKKCSLGTTQAIFWRRQTPQTRSHSRAIHPNQTKVLKKNEPTFTHHVQCVQYCAWTELKTPLN